MKYKDLQNRVHDPLGHPELMPGWPIGYTEITDAEAEALLNPTKPLETRQAERWELIKNHRDDLRFNGGVKVGTNWFLSTQLATSEYNAMLALYGALPDTTVLRAAWRTMNGALIDMTPLLCRQILTAGVAQAMAIDDAAQSHRDAMEASATPETYNFSTGWPAIYQ